MKLRHGFVSNSSSTSFSIYGKCVEVDQLMMALGIMPYEDDADADDCDGRDDIYTVAERMGFEVYMGDAEYAYVGISWASMGEQERKCDFKVRVAELLAKIPEQCDTHTEVTYS